MITHFSCIFVSNIGLTHFISSFDALLQNSLTSYQSLSCTIFRIFRWVLFYCLIFTILSHITTVLIRLILFVKKMVQIIYRNFFEKTLKKSVHKNKNKNIEYLKRNEFTNRKILNIFAHTINFRTRKIQLVNV